MSRFSISSSFHSPAPIPGRLMSSLGFVSQTGLLGSETGPFRSGATCRSRRARKLLVCRQSFDRDSYEKGFQSAVEEKSEILSEIIGVVPKDLKGTYFRNGPGRQEAGGVAEKANEFAHPRDGDGMLVAFSFEDGNVWFQNRFVRTKGKAYEEIRSKILFRGAYGTKKPGGWASNLLELFPKNTSNDGIIYLRSERKLLSLWSMGLPHIVDPEGLVTDGTSRLRESLPENKASFCSRPKELDGLITGFGKDPTDGRLFFLEFETDGFKFSRQLKPSGGPKGLVRDFGVTTSFFTAIEEPTKFDTAGFSLGSKSWSQAWSIDVSGTSVLWFLSRDEMPSWKSYLLGESYQVLEIVDSSDGKEETYVDAVVIKSESSMFWGETADLPEFPRRQLVRFTLSGDSISTKSLSDRCFDFVTSNGQYLYGVSPLEATEAGPVQCLVQLDKNTLSEKVWIPEAHQFCGEPLAAAGQDRNYLISLVFDGNQDASFLLVLDAISMEEICRVGTRTRIPHGRFGTWTSDSFSKENERKKSSYELFLEKGWNNMESSFPLL